MALNQVKYHLKNFRANWRKVIWLYNSQKVNSLLTSNLLILIYFLELISILIEDAPTLQSAEIFHQFDYAFLAISYYCNPFNILSQKLNIDIIIMMIFIIVFHLLLILTYVFTTIFLELFDNKKFAIWNWFLFFIGYLQKVYLWVIYFPSLDATLHCLKYHSSSIENVLLALIALLFVAFFQLILYFSRMNMDFIPKDEIATRFTNVIESIVIIQTILILTMQLVPSLYYSSIVALISLIIAIWKVIQYIKDLPFCNESISSNYGTLCLIYLYLVCIIGLNQNDYNHFSLFVFAIIGIGFLIPFSLILRRHIIYNLFLSTDYSKLPNAKFYFLIKHLILLSKDTVNKTRKFSTIYLIIFLRNHVYQCKDYTCPCKNDDLLNKQPLETQNILEKNMISIIYKTIIYQIINKSFDIKNLNNSNGFDLELKLLQALFLIYYAKKNIKAYVLLSSITESKELSLKQKFTLNNIKDQMEKILINGDKKVLYRDVILFYNYMDKLKMQISHLMNFYLDFFYELLNTMVKLDTIMIKGKNILNTKKEILETVKATEKIYSYSKELNYIFTMYGSLQSTDEITDYINQENKVNKYIKMLIHHEANEVYIKLDDYIAQIFSEHNCIIFVNLANKKFGKINCVTPNFSTIFGYPLSEVPYIALNSLMPNIVASIHDNLISKIIEKESISKLETKTTIIYALDKEKFLIPLEKSIKLESLNGELCVTAFIKKIRKTPQMILTYKNGCIMNFSQGFKEYLVFDSESNITKNINLIYILPKLLLSVVLDEINNYENQPKSQLSINDYSNFIYILNNLRNADKWCIKNVTEEMVYLIFPKQKQTYIDISNFHKKLANNNLISLEDNLQFKDLIYGLSYIYDGYTQEDIIICQASISYKIIDIHKANTDMRLLEINYIEMIENIDYSGILSQIRTFIKALKDLFFNPENEFAVENFTNSLKHISPINYYNEIENLSLQNKSNHTKSIMNQAFTPLELFSTIGAGQAPDSILPTNSNNNHIYVIDSKSDENINHDLLDIEANEFNNIANLRDYSTSKRFLRKADQKPLEDIIQTTTREVPLPITFTERQLSNFIEAAELSSPIRTNNNSVLELCNNEGFNNLQNIIFQKAIRQTVMEEVSQKTGAFKIQMYNNSNNINVDSSMNSDHGALAQSKAGLKESQAMSPKRQDKTRKLIRKSIKVVSIKKQRKFVFGKNENNLSNDESFDPIKIKKKKDKLWKTKNSINENEYEQKKRLNLKRELFENQSSHQSKSSGNNTIKMFKKLLVGKIFISGLNKMNHFGVFSLLIFLGVIIILSSLFIINLNKYSLYVRTSDFSNSLLSSIAVYNKHITMKLLQNDNIFNGLDYMDMENKSKLMINKKYELYKKTLDSILYQQELFSESYSIKLTDYPLNILRIDNDVSQEIELDLTFTYGSQIIINEMNEILTMNDPIIDNSSSIEFFRKNYPEYFKTFIRITSDIGSEAHGSKVVLDMKSFAVTALIICLCVAFAFLAPIYPIYRQVEINQEKGLSLLTRFSDEDLHYIIQVVKNILFAMKNQKAIFEAQRMKVDHEVSLKSKFKFLKGQPKTTKKNIREWRKRRSNPIMFISSLLLIFGLLGAYYILFSIRIIYHNINFNQFYTELDLASNAYVCISSTYYTTNLVLRLYGETNTWQNYFNTNYTYLQNYCSNIAKDITNFWIDIDAYIDQNSDITDKYLSQAHEIKNGDLCKFIQSSIYPMSNANITECSDSFASVAQKGIIQLMTSLYYTFQTITSNVILSNYSRQATIDTIKGMDFKGFDNLFTYSDFIFRQYVENLRDIILQIISKQIIEAYIFLIIGITILAIGYRFIWLPFLTFTKEDFTLSKKLLCVFPIQIIIGNHYIKKWLIDNSKHSLW